MALKKISYNSQKLVSLLDNAAQIEQTAVEVNAAKTQAMLYQEQAAAFAKTAETAASTAESWRDKAQTAANTAKDAAQQAAATRKAVQDSLVIAQNDVIKAQTAAISAEQSAQKAQDAIGKTNYIGSNGNWYVWNPAQNTFLDSGISAKGEKGEAGQNGVVLDGSLKNGQFGFEIVNGNLYLVLPDGSNAPDFSIDSNGHLIYEFGA